MQHASGGRRLAAVDHAAAGLNRQIALECKVGLFKEGFVVSAGESQVLKLNHHDGNVIVVEIETANVFVGNSGHIESSLSGLRNARNQRISAITRPEACVIAFAPT